ncbi:hypothetical protein ACDF64_05485 [Agromyces sp. MMS24-JH15]|uniref:hypothetical protein n=1 Tax=Agromyces sp. MMS24-JH15 TaxID=3243765 RepID=UPI00374A187D
MMTRRARRPTGPPIEAGLGLGLGLLAIVALGGCAGLDGFGVYDPTPSVGGTATATAQPTTSEPTPSGDADGGGGGNDDDDGGASVVYAFTLPASDSGASTNDNEAYVLLAGSCTAAQAFLESKAPASPGDFGYGFSGPRFTMLLKAGIEVCLGNLDAGREWTTRALDTYGIDALGPELRAECGLYRTLLSVLEQRPQESYLPCSTDGEVPGWKDTLDENGIPVLRDDPLTLDVDESIPPPTTPPTDGSAPPTDGSAPPTSRTAAPVPGDPDATTVEGSAP